MRMSVVLPLVLLAGCATAPPSLEVRNPRGVTVAQGVVLCRTTLSELEGQLGAPSRDGRLGPMRLVTWVVDWEPLVKYLGVMIDASGRVVDLYWDVPSEVQWAPADRCR